MSRKASKRVSFSPDVNDKPAIFLKHGGGTRVAGSRKRVIGIWSFSRLPKDSEFSPVKFLERLQAKVVGTIRLMSLRRSSSRKVSSSLVRSRSVSDPIDSHRAEAIEDCIEFLNSSSSLPRSNSVSSRSC
ncbi:hypothetical protein CFP56_030173 [Quercus suber]|uniref:Josephin-like protein n=1 Tax=Quercus suber TaxID=58331 RepID=A0AAW0LWI4_QUESU|nr:josephin-like protein [Quercus suber]POF01622.1 hypothetical protein CFP56_64916 [Quercus suber]